jgi:hypothetical protein
MALALILDTFVFRREVKSWTGISPLNFSIMGASLVATSVISLFYLKWAHSFTMCGTLG